MIHELPRAEHEDSCHIKSPISTPALTMTSPPCTPSKRTYADAELENAKAIAFTTSPSNPESASAPETAGMIDAQAALLAEAKLQSPPRSQISSSARNVLAAHTSADEAATGPIAKKIKLAVPEQDVKQLSRLARDCQRAEERAKKQQEKEEKDRLKAEERARREEQKRIQELEKDEKRKIKEQQNKAREDEKRKREEEVAKKQEEKSKKERVGNLVGFSFIEYLFILNSRNFVSTLSSPNPSSRMSAPENLQCARSIASQAVVGILSHLCKAQNQRGGSDPYL